MQYITPIEIIRINALPTDIVLINIRHITSYMQHTTHRYNTRPLNVNVISKKFKSTIHMCDMNIKFKSVLNRRFIEYPGRALYQIIHYFATFTNSQRFNNTRARVLLFFFPIFFHRCHRDVTYY